MQSSKITENAIITAKQLYKNYQNTQALRGADFTISKGEIVAIMGHSGSGKSTLLHCLAGIELPDSGQVYYCEKDITKLTDKERSILRRTQFGFIFQFGQLVPELTVLDNVALPLLLNAVPKKSAYKDAQLWLQRVGLKEKEHSLPGELSGGQAQRVAIARAMIIEPVILFADEPTGSLDSFNSEKIMELFVSTARETKTTVIMVTHEPTIAAYADREVVVRDGIVINP